MEKAQRWAGNLQDGTKCVFYLEDGQTRLEIDRHHEHPRDMFQAPEEPERLVVQLSDGKVATFTGVYRTRRSADMTQSFEEYRANITYLGPEEFRPEHGVVRLTFRPSNERLAVMYSRHRAHGTVDAEDASLETITAGNGPGRRFYVDIIDSARLRAFTARTGDLEVAGNIGLSISSDMHGQRTKEHRTVSLQYERPTTLAFTIPDILATCDFISLIIGAVVSPITLNATTVGDRDRFDRPPTFDIYAGWREAGHEIEPRKGHRCLAAPMFDVDLYERAISNWLGRRQEWSTSYALGTVCLAHQEEISSRRFLDAAAWFESIPVTVYERQRERIGRDILEAASTAAAAVFQANGADVSESRARALLGPVNAASLNVRINDAMTFARSSFGQDILPPSLDRLASVISRIRGRFAHGEDAFASDLGHLVYDATLLLEALACMLTLEGLGGIQLTPDNGGHPIHRTLSELRVFNA